MTTYPFAHNNGQTCAKDTSDFHYIYQLPQLGTCRKQIGTPILRLTFVSKQYKDQDLNI